MSPRLAAPADYDELRHALGPGPWSLSTVLEHGWSRAKVRCAVDAGRLLRPSRGVLALPDAPFGAARAALLSAREGAVLSHESAADVQTLWLPRRRTTWEHLTIPGEPDRTDHGVRIHGSRLPSSLVTEVDGLPVTCVARTAVDLARGGGLPDVLVLLDSAARLLAVDVLGLASADFRDAHVRLRALEVATPLLWEAFESVRSWPGTVIVREALTHVDVASESPFESASRGRIIRANLPMPQTAYAVRGASGARYWADFAWPESRLLGEADGTGKYGINETDVRERLRNERRRQRDLEDAGWLLVRWDSTEPARAVIRRLQNALRGTGLESLA